MDSPIPPKSSCLRVFDTPELSRSIAHEITSTKDQIALLHICRQFFENIRPFVWESVPDATVLILLIPGANITVRHGGTQGSLYTITSFPEIFDLSRFNLYAPHICTMGLPALFRADDNNLNRWSKFLTHASTLNLLPNLKEMTRLPDVAGQERLVQESITILAAFLSPSMSKLEIFARPQKHIEFEHFDNLLETIIEKCPKLESFSVSPGHQNPANPAYLDDADMTNLDAENLVEATDPITSRQPRASLSSPCVRTNYLISQLTCLRSITTSGFILEHESFIVLSQLPRLEALSVSCDSYNDPWTYGANLEIPLTAFPALKSFNLTHTLHSTVINLCSIQSFVNTLEGLRLNFHTYRPSPSMDPEPVDIAGILTPITTFGLCITKLTLTQRCSWIVPPEIIQSLKRLPLTNLYLGEINFKTFDLQGLVRALPRLEELRLGSSTRSFPIKNLRIIATSLPVLRHLSLLFRFDSIYDVTDEDLKPLGLERPSNMYFESDFCPFRRQSAASKRIATYLYSLWPNITCVQYGSIPPPGGFSEHFEGGMFWDDPGPEDEEFDNLETIGRTLDELRTRSEGA